MNQGLYDLIAKLDDFSPGYAAKAANQLREPKRTENLREILRKQFAKGDIKSLLATADHLSTPERVRELGVIIKEQIQEAKAGVLLAKLANTLPEPERSVYLEQILQELISADFLQKACQVADIILDSK